MSEQRSGYGRGRDLVGVKEVAGMLGVSRSALASRRRRREFPEPVATLAAGPIWTRGQIVAYARWRCEQFVEADGVRACAGLPPRGHTPSRPE